MKEEQLSILTDKERLLLYRFYYRIGEPLVSDLLYDTFLDTLLSAENPDPEIVEIASRLWDDEPVPYEVLNKFYSLTEITNLVKDYGLVSTDKIHSEPISTAEFKATSIRPYRDMHEAYEWFKDMVGIELCATPKLDGISSSSSYKDSKLEYSRTRGRGGSSKFFDITTNMSKILPTSINRDYITVNGECFVPEASLPAVSREAGHNYVAPRSAATATVRRTDLQDSTIALTKCYVFNASVGNTLSESLDIAKLCGFDTVPYWLKVFKGFANFSDFEEQISSFVGEIKSWADQHGLPTDGVVFQVNDKSAFNDSSITGHYASGNMAFKCLLWNPGEYTSEVTNLIIEKEGDSLENYCVKVRVKPVQMESGKTLKTVNLYNLGNLIKHDIHIGDYITFIHKNDTTNEFIRKAAKPLSKEFYAYRNWINENLDRIFGDGAGTPAYDNAPIYDTPETYIKQVTYICEQVVIHISSTYECAELLDIIYYKSIIQSNTDALDEAFPTFSNIISGIITDARNRSCEISTADESAKKLLDKIMRNNGESLREILSTTPANVLENAVHRVLLYNQAIQSEDFKAHYYSFVGKQLLDMLVMLKPSHPAQLTNYLIMGEKLHWVDWNDALSTSVYFARCRHYCPAFLKGGLTDETIASLFNAVIVVLLGHAKDTYDVWYEQNKELIFNSLLDNIDRNDEICDLGDEIDQSSDTAFFGENK